MLTRCIPKALCATLILLEQCLLCTAIRGVPNNQILAAYNESLQLSGQMVGNDIDFTDGLTLNVFTPDNTTMMAVQNFSPLTGRYVTGDANGGLYRAISNYSWIISTNNQAQNLIATLNIPYDPAMLAAYQIDPSNTFVAKLASDNQSWVLGDQITVNKYIFKSQVSHLNSIDGEYRLIGRIDPTITGANFADFGGPYIAFLAGGFQDAEYIDGLRFSILSNTNLTMSVDIGNPVSAVSLPSGMQSLNSFAYVVNTTVVDALNLPQPAIPSNGSAATLAPSAATSIVNASPETSAAPLPTLVTSLITSVFTITTTIDASLPTSAVGASNGSDASVGAQANSASSAALIGTSATSSAAPVTTVSGSSFGGDAPADGPFNGDPSTTTLTNIPGRFRRQVASAASSALQVSEGPSSTVQILASAASSVGSSPSSASAAAAAASSVPTSVLSVDGSSPSSTTALAAAAATTPTFSNGTVPASAASSTPVAGAVQQATIAFPINMNVLIGLIGQNTTSNSTSALSVVQQSTSQSPLGISSSDADDAILRSVALQVARRDVGASNASFVPIAASSSSSSSSGVTLSISQGKLVVNGITALDGEYVILVPMSAAVSSASVSGSGSLSVSGSNTTISSAPGKAGYTSTNGASGASRSWSATLGAGVLGGLVLILETI